MTVESTTLIDIELCCAGAEEKEKLRAFINSDIIYLSPAILRFAIRMEAKLAKNKSFGDLYKTKQYIPLVDALELHIKKMDFRWLADKDTEQLVQDAADVANFAMFIALNAMEGRFEK